MRFVLLIAALAAIAAAQTMGPGSLPDMTGNGATQRITAVSTMARAACFTAPAANSAPVRVGDANTGASRGQYIAAGGAYCPPPASADPRASYTQHFYDLSKFYFYGGVGDKISIMWVN